MRALQKQYIVDIFVWVGDSLPKPSSSRGRKSILQDSELMTIFIWNGLTEPHKTLRSVYDWVLREYADYFPRLPKYQNFVAHAHRLLPLLVWFLRSILSTGDVATFGLTEEELSLKELREQQALESLLGKLPPHTASILRRYEAQQEPEARFVRLLEKGLPLIVNSTGSGERVMREDFGIEDGQSLASTEENCASRLRSLFPEADLDIIHSLREILAQNFQSIFEQTCPS